MVTVGPDGGPSYDFRVVGTADWQWTAAELADALRSRTRWPGARPALRVARAHHPARGRRAARLMARAAQTATVSYDPNCRPA